MKINNVYVLYNGKWLIGKWSWPLAYPVNKPDVKRRCKKCVHSDSCENMSETILGYTHPTTKKCCLFCSSHNEMCLWNTVSPTGASWVWQSGSREQNGQWRRKWITNLNALLHVHKMLLEQLKSAVRQTKMNRPDKKIVFDLIKTETVIVSDTHPEAGLWHQVSGLELWAKDFPYVFYDSVKFKWNPIHVTKLTARKMFQALFFENTYFYV